VIEVVIAIVVAVYGSRNMEAIGRSSSGIYSSYSVVKSRLRIGDGNLMRSGSL
jgi:hypothetical protein